jgi:purine-binding chemotaxis protein CheW
MKDLKSTQENSRFALAASQQQRILAATAQLQRMQSGQLANDDSVEQVLAAIGEQYLVFSLQNREFAVKAEAIQGVERPMYITPVPNVVSWVQGVVNLRGAIASVVNFRAFLELEQIPADARTRLLSVQANEMVICLTVDSVSDMVQIPLAAVVSGSVQPTTIPQWIAPYASTYAVVGNRIIVLLDVTRLLFSDKMQHYSQ